MDILFLLLGFSHQSAQCINTSCSTSSLSPWFCLAGRRAFGLSCALFLGSWRMWQQLLHVQPSLSPSETAGCCLTRRAYIQWVRPSAPGHIQSSLAPGMNEFAIWDGPCSPFVCGPAKPSTCPPGGSILSQAFCCCAEQALSLASQGIWRAPQISLFSSGCLHHFSKVVVHSS